MRAEEKLTAGDYGGAMIAAMAIVGPLTLPLWSFRFTRIFADFGGELPWITRLALQPWFGPALAAVPLGLLVISFVQTHGPLARRRALIVAAFLAGSIASAICSYALYAPIFELAGAIK